MASEIPPEDFQRQLRMLLADRQTPEARALYLTLLKYIDRRVSRTVHRACGGVFSESEREELVSEVLMQLVSGSLHRFRGESLPELLGYVRTICDRTVWRAAKRVVRERDAVEGEDARLIEGWFATLSGPSEGVTMVEESPLEEKDERYLRALLEAGSKVELARREGVSRAAVTQRVQRIRKRIAKLGRPQQQAVDVWLKNQAREVLAG